LHRPPFALPLLKAAVEHAGAIVSEDPQHPPQARRPPVIRRGIGNHVSFIADAKRSHCLREHFGRGQHEMQARVSRGHIVLDIEKDRSGNVGLLEVRTAGYDVVQRKVGQRRQVRRAVHDAHLRIVQPLRQPLGIHQIFGMRKSAGHGNSASSDLDWSSDGSRIRCLA